MTEINKSGWLKSVKESDNKNMVDVEIVGIDGSVISWCVLRSKNEQVSQK